MKTVPLLVYHTYWLEPKAGAYLIFEQVCVGPPPGES